MDINVDPLIIHFSAKFCKELDKKKNCVSSPPLAAEIITVVMCLQNFEETCSTFPNTFNISDISNLHLSFLWPFLKLKAVKARTLSYANKVYVSKSQWELNPSLKKDAQKIFNVEVEKIDFTKSDYAANRINKWIEKRIKKSEGVFHSDSFDTNTNVMLVSSVHFKGIWQMKFDPEDTEETIFHLNNRETVNVFLMYRKEKYKYKYSEDLEAQVNNALDAATNLIVISRHLHPEP